MAWHGPGPPAITLLGYPKLLDVNPTPGRFDSGTMWTNAQFVSSADGKMQRLYYGAYQSWGVKGGGGGVSQDSAIGVAQIDDD
jgi:hypothetical protein